MAYQTLAAPRRLQGLGALANTSESGDIAVSGVPAVALVNSTYPLTITITNTGTDAWDPLSPPQSDPSVQQFLQMTGTTSGPYRYKMESQNVLSGGAGVRLDPASVELVLPGQTLPPGASLTIQATLTIGSIPGPAILNVAVSHYLSPAVSVGVALATLNFTVTTQPGATPLPAQPTPGPLASSLLANSRTDSRTLLTSAISLLAQARASLTPLLQHTDPNIRTAAQTLLQTQVNLEGSISRVQQLLPQTGTGTLSQDDGNFLDDWALRTLMYLSQVDNLTADAARVPASVIQSTALDTLLTPAASTSQAPPPATTAQAAQQPSAAPLLLGALAWFFSR